MIKTNKETYEFLFSQTAEIFNIPVPCKFTWQQLYFTELCRSTFFGVGFLSEEKTNLFNEEFLSWQNKRFPSFDWVDIEEIKENGTISEFMHSLDFKWNDLESPMIKYIMLNTIEIGCETYQDFLKEDFMGDE